MEAQCLCGAITVRIIDPEVAAKPPMGICHCHNCKTSSGSAFASNMWIQSSQLEVDGKEHLGCFERVSGSGNHLKRYFCAKCGNLIKIEIYERVMDDKGGFKELGNVKGVIVPMGKFLDLPTPFIEGFTKRRCPWLAEIEGAQQMD